MVIGSFVICAVAVFNMFFETDLINQKIRVIDFFAPKYTYISYGTAFGFVANVQAMGTEEPEGYTTGKVQEILNNASEASQPADVTDQKPNIIVIMNEAYSDLSLVGDYKTNMDYRPYTRTLDENTTQGTLYVSVFGGCNQ